MFVECRRGNIAWGSEETWEARKVVAPTVSMTTVKNSLPSCYVKAVEKIWGNIPHRIVEYRRKVQLCMRKLTLASCNNRNEGFTSYSSSFNQIYIVTNRNVGVLACVSAWLPNVLLDRPQKF
jgi:hypothetical protein